MRGRIVLGVLACCVATATSAQIRLESETPAGAVPPPPAQQAVDGLPGETGTMARPMDDGGVDVADVVRRFADAYSAQGAPRVIVLFNRELSADVREWVASERIAIERGDSDRSAAISRQYATPDGGRVGPGERWMWEFEQAISDLLLDARVTLVDRAVAMRRQAAEAGTSLGNPESARTVELEALDRYADMLVEVWVVRSTDSPIGYEFRAQAKNIADGRLVTTVTTWGDGLPQSGPRPVRATDRGYEFIDEVPTVTDAAQALGVELMGSLIRRW